MKTFFLLLLVGLVSCNIDSEGVDPCAIKEGYIGSSIDDSIGGSSKSSLLTTSATAGLFGQDIPPAVADTTPISGLDGSYGDILSGGSGISPPYPSGDLVIPSDPALCVRHRLVSRVRPVVEEHYHNVPVVRNFVRNRQELYTRHVPVVTKHLTSSEDKRVRHVPVLKKRARTVIDEETRHIPIVRKRIVPVVERYVKHVPVTRCYVRPLVDEDRSNVPVVQRRIRPVVTQRIRHVPVTERRYRPVFETRVVNIPVKQQVVRHLVERRIHRTHEPCDYPIYYGEGSPYRVSPYSPYGLSNYVVSPSAASYSPVSTIGIPGQHVVVTGADVSQGHHTNSGCTCFC